MTFLLLAGAIASEVAATLSLRVHATTSKQHWLAVIVLGYLTAFTLLALALDEGIAIGVAYGIWSASGVAITAVAARYLFNDPLTRKMLAGIALIIAGVLMIELGANH